MLEAAEADLAPEAGFCPCERRQAFPEIWSPSSSTRTNGVSGFAMAASVLSRAARRTSSTQAAGPNPLWDILMTLQVYMRNRSVRCRRALGGAPRSTRFGQLASSIYRSLTERIQFQLN